MDRTDDFSTVFNYVYGVRGYRADRIHMHAVGITEGKGLEKYLTV